MLRLFTSVDIYFLLKIHFWLLSYNAHRILHCIGYSWLI